MALGYVLAWPSARINVKGDRVVLRQGDVVPADADDLDTLSLVGAVVAVEVPEEVAPAASAPTSVKDILAEVGDDVDAAKAALAAEYEAKGDRARPSLVESLEAIINAAAADKGDG